MNIETNRFTPIQLPEFFTEKLIDESTLSPDEKQIAFVLLGPTEIKRQLYIMPVTGGEFFPFAMPVTGEMPKQLTRGEFFPFALRWSPDGRTIAFIRRILSRTEMPSRSGVATMRGFRIGR